MLLLEVFPLGHIHSLPCKTHTAGILPAVRTVQDAASGVWKMLGIPHDHMGLNICNMSATHYDN